MKPDEERRIENFFAQFTTVTKKKGTTILLGGEEPKGIYYLRRGYIKQYTVSSDGTPLIFHIFRPGAFFPLTWVLLHAPSPYIHEALTTVAFSRAPEDAVVAFITDHPWLMERLSQRLMGAVMGLCRRIETLTLEDAQKRTIGMLLYLAEIIGKKDGTGIIIPVVLPHREIAAWIGTTRETASLRIEELLRDGVVVARGRFFVIPNLKKLAQMA